MSANMESWLMPSKTSLRELSSNGGAGLAVCPVFLGLFNDLWPAGLGTGVIEGEVEGLENRSASPRFKIGSSRSATGLGRITVSMSGSTGTAGGAATSRAGRAATAIVTIGGTTRTGKAGGAGATATGGPIG